MAIGREMYITKQDPGDRFMTVKMKKHFQEKDICMEEEYPEKKRAVECYSSKTFGTGNILVSEQQKKKIGWLGLF